MSDSLDLEYRINELRGVAQSLRALASYDIMTRPEALQLLGSIIDAKASKMDGGRTAD